MRLLTPALLYLLTPTLGVAQVTTDSLRPSQTMEAVVVTGTQTPRSLKKLPIPVQVITHAELERVHPRSAADALQMLLPGVQLEVHGGQQRITIQGMPGDYLLFLVNGEKLTSEGNGVVDLTRIDITTIERIEIIRGAASALYGSSAIGAVVNFITKQAQRPLQGSLTSDVSSEGTARYHASAGLRYRQLTSLTTFGYVHQDPYSVATREDGRLAPSLFVGAKTSLVSEELRYSTPDRRLQLGGYLRYSFRDQDKDQVTQLHYKSYHLGGNTSWIIASQHGLQLNYNKELYDRSNWFPSISMATPIFRFHAHTARLQYNYGEEGKTHLFANVGSEYYQERLQGDRFSDIRLIRRAWLASLYGQGEWRPNDCFSLMAGLRLDKHSRFGAHLSPRLSALYTLGKKWRLRASYAEGFRSPSIKELYMDWNHQNMFFIRGSEDLSPEVSHLFSLAPEYQGKRLNATLIASYNLVRHSIELVSEDEGATMRYRNTSGTTRVLNLQTSLRYQLPSGLHLSADYAYLRNYASVTDPAGRSYSYSSLRPHNLTLTLSYEHRLPQQLALSANYSLRASSALKTLRFDSASERYHDVSYSGFSSSRVSLTGAWRAKLRISLGVDNLFDYVPESISISGSLSPGRTFFTSLTYTL